MLMDQTMIKAPITHRQFMVFTIALLVYAKR